MEKKEIITEANETIPNSSGLTNLANTADTISATAVDEYFSTADQNTPVTNLDFSDISDFNVR
ncbi:hypothetical protein KUBF_21620 [Bacteroides finegoldii]|nr:hypothetical protein KUBF_21620 [Bacteroides finegoldii]